MKPKLSSKHEARSTIGCRLSDKQQYLVLLPKKGIDTEIRGQRDDQ